MKKGKEFGTLDGKEVELTEEFVRNTPDVDLERVVMTTESGATLRPFRLIRENPDDQIGC
jgi:hypothetical protein